LLSAETIGVGQVEFLRRERHRHVVREAESEVAAVGRDGDGSGIVV
jgi:hypothetical protein